jgi:predicted AAA+ superfamily ATPase
MMEIPLSAENNDLYPRHLSHVLIEALADTPVVCLLGPRQSGKTTLARSLDPDRVYISLDEQNYYHLAIEDPAGFIGGLPDSVTLDEVQRVPGLLTEIKRAVDENRRPGRFLLTGSANLLFLPQVAESLAGRMEIVHLHPLTEAEKERKPGNFLRLLLDGALKSGIGVEREEKISLAESLVAGGYPEPIRRTFARARRWHRQYLRSIIDRDVRDVARIKDSSELARLLELLALRTAELLNASDIARVLGLHRETIDNYIAILERLFLVRKLPAWHNNPGHRLIKSPKIHVVDSGLAATLADYTAADWFEQRERMGHLLESYVVQQIMAQAEWTNPDLRFWHYREKDGQEVDLVITRGKKTWGIEVKASSAVNRKDGRGLEHLARQCGKNFQGGFLLYDGKDVLPLGATNLLAVPISRLWEL